MALVNGLCSLSPFRVISDFLCQLFFFQIFNTHCRILSFTKVFVSFQVTEVTGPTDLTEVIITGPTDQTRVASTREASTATLERTETCRSARTTGRPAQVSVTGTLRQRGREPGHH